MAGIVADIEKEIEYEYSIAKGIEVSGKIGVPKHVTIVVHLRDKNWNEICVLAEYKDGEFATNTLSSRAHGGWARVVF